MGVTQVYNQVVNNIHNLVFLKGTFCNIKQVNIIWEDAGTSEYYIEVSTDGDNYTKIAEAEGMGRQQNRNDAIILFNMSNARYVRIVGTARNTNYGYSIWNMAIYGMEDLKVDETTMPEQTTQRPTSPEVTTTPVATKSDMITNQAAMEPVSTSEQTTAKHSIKVAKTKVKKAAKDKKKCYGSWSRIKKLSME